MIVAAVQSKGGVGKTTLAVHLGAHLAAVGKRVVVVDADPNRSSSEYLRDAAPELQVERADSGDDLLDGLPQLDGDGVVVVVDAPAGSDEAVRAVLLRAHLAIVPTGPGALDLRALVRTSRLIAQARSIRGGVPAAVVVVNRIRSGSNLAREASTLAAEAGLPVARSMLAERVGLADAVGQGRLAWNWPASEASAVELRALFAELLEEHLHLE